AAERAGAGGQPVGVAAGARMGALGDPAVEPPAAAAAGRHGRTLRLAAGCGPVVGVGRGAGGCGPVAGAGAGAGAAGGVGGRALLEARPRRDFRRLPGCRDRGDGNGAAAGAGPGAAGPVTGAVSHTAAAAQAGAVGLQRSDCTNAAAMASSPAWSCASKRSGSGLSRSNTPIRVSPSNSGTTSSEREAESQAIWPGKACTSATRWVWRVLAAAPHTPLSSGMRTQAGRPWNGPTTSSVPS